MELLDGDAGDLGLGMAPVVGVLVGICLLAWLYVGARFSLQHWDKRANRVPPDLRRADDRETAAPGFSWMQPNDPDRTEALGHRGVDVTASTPPPTTCVGRTTTRGGRTSRRT